MNIAICDDDRLMSGQIEKLVEKVFHGETSKYNTEVFFSGDRLLDFLAQSPNYFILPKHPTRNENDSLLEVLREKIPFVILRR